MSKEELISVIIPVYNVEKYLSKCIESVIEQTYPNLDIILINDGSSDRSGEICDEYYKHDKRIRVIHQSNHGLAYVRNVGIKESKGNFLCWVDSDDYICETMIEELYCNLCENNADMSICSYIQGSERNFVFSSDRTKEVFLYDYKKGLEMIYESHKFSFIMVAAWGKLIKKELYNNLQYPTGKLFEDIYLSHRLISKCKKIVYTNKEMYYYFQSPDSILGQKLHRAKLDYLDAFEDRIHFYKEIGLAELSEEARIHFLHALTWEYSRAKDILHDKDMVHKVKLKYRKYYKLGIQNQKVTHETSGYMLSFYISPWWTDFIGKVKQKIKCLRKG